MSEKIIDKIKKLLALSKSDNPNEAALALQKAQALMQEHNITMGRISLSDITGAFIPSQFSISRLKPFESDLVINIAKLFQCEVLWMGAQSRKQGGNPAGKYHLIGPKSQIEIAEYTCVVFMRKLKKAREAHKKEIQAMRPFFFPTKAELIARLDSFCLGWSYEVLSKVAQFAGNPDVAEMRQAYKKEVLGLGKLNQSSLKKLSVRETDYRIGTEAASKESILRPAQDMRGETLAITGEK